MPLPSGPGSHGPKKSKDPQQSKQTQQKPGQTKKRLTKKEQDEAAVQKFLSSPAGEIWIEEQLDKKRRSDRLDKVYKRAEKVMRQFALLADGDLRCTQKKEIFFWSTLAR